MIIFGFVEHSSRGNFGYDLVAECSTFVQFGFILLSLKLLFLIMIKNGAPVLRSYVIALPVQRGRIMGFPEYLQEFVKSYLRRIVTPVYWLGVGGGSRAYLFVARIFYMSAGIT